jgi:NADH:ubiquinone oxidoreductase subunit
VWERPWTPNATGTQAAYRPAGSLDAGGKRARATGDYRAWSPEGDPPSLAPKD